MSERTFSIIKPDAVAAGQSGAILARLEQAGFRIVAARMRRLTRAQAEGRGALREPTLAEARWPREFESQYVLQTVEVFHRGQR